MLTSHLEGGMLVAGQAARGRARGLPPAQGSASSGIRGGAARTRRQTNSGHMSLHPQTCHES